MARIPRRVGELRGRGVSGVMGKSRGAVIGALAVLVLAGCAAVVPRESFTAQQVGAAEVPGFANVRYWADAATPALTRMVDQRFREARQNKNIDWLMLSGGGEDGAFGAGVLYGMTEAG